MGYNAAPRTVKIQFAEGHAFHGAEARARRMSYGEWEALMEREDHSATDEFGKRLVSWNLTDDDDQPISATAEGLRQIDITLAVALKDAWLQSITGVHDADPLSGTSSSGETSPAPAIPMTPIDGSTSLAS